MTKIELYNELVKLVCNKFEVSVDEVTSNSKFEEAVYCRNICIYILRVKFRYSARRLGIMFSRTNQSIYKSIFYITNLLETDSRLKYNIKSFVDKLNEMIEQSNSKE